MKKISLLIASISICLVLSGCDKTEGSFVLRAPVSEDSSVVPSSETPSRTSSMNTSSNNSGTSFTSNLSSTYNSNSPSSSASDYSRAFNSSNSTNSSNPSSNSSNSDISEDSSILPIYIDTDPPIDSKNHYYDFIHTTATSAIDYQDPTEITVGFIVDGDNLYQIDFAHKDAYKILSYLDTCSFTRMADISDINNRQDSSINDLIVNGVIIWASYHYVDAPSNESNANAIFLINKDGTFGFTGQQRDYFYYTDAFALNYDEFATLIKRTEFECNYSESIPGTHYMDVIDSNSLIGFVYDDPIRTGVSMSIYQSSVLVIEGSTGYQILSTFDDVALVYKTSVSIFESIGMILFNDFIITSATYRHPTAASTTQVDASVYFRLATDGTLFFFDNNQQNCYFTEANAVDYDAFKELISQVRANLTLEG